MLLRNAGRWRSNAGVVRRAAVPFAALLCVLAMSSNLPARAQDAAAASSETGAQDEIVTVDGFRSSKFGMTQEEVRKAIKADFEVDADKIAESENAAERTKLLTITVPDLLSDGGTAQVSWVFGYKTGGLIQVGISWNKAVDEEMTAQKLQANGEVLRSHFMSAGYRPDSIQTGVITENGVLLFRGLDSEGHATIVLLQGQFSAQEGTDQRILTPVSLALLYSADPDNPDVFKIEPGKF